MAKDKNKDATLDEDPILEPASPPVAVEDPPAEESPTEEEAQTFETPDTTDEEEFREQQKQQAAAQNLTQENAVPEQRPQAFLEPPAPHSELTQKLIDEGVINNDPMPASAFEKAASQEQMDKAAEESRVPQIHPGLVVRVTKGPHEGRIVAVTRITEYESTEDLALVTAGVPEARFVKPAEIEGRARGDDRDGEVLILNVDDAGLEIIRDWRGTGRG